MFDKALRLYILARLDLTSSQRAVQACHALARLMLRGTEDPCLKQWGADHHTLVILGVDDEVELRRWEDELRKRGVTFEHFCEPDLENQMTAIAIHPAADSRLFRELQLL